MINEKDQLNKFVKDAKQDHGDAWGGQVVNYAIGLAVRLDMAADPLRKQLTNDHYETKLSWTHNSGAAEAKDEVATKLLELAANSFRAKRDEDAKLLRGMADSVSKDAQILWDKVLELRNKCESIEKQLAVLPA